MKQTSLNPSALCLRALSPQGLAPDPAVDESGMFHKWGWSQSDLARACLKDRQAIEKLENGKVNPTVYSLAEIAKGLGVKVRDIVNFGEYSAKMSGNQRNNKKSTGKPRK